MVVVVGGSVNVDMNLPALHHSAREITAVLALHCDVFGTTERRLEGWAAVSYAIR